MVEMVQTQGQFIGVVRPVLDHGLGQPVLLLESLMLFAHHIEVLKPSEVVVVLEQDCIIFVLLKVQNSFQILLIEVFLREFLQD